MNLHEAVTGMLARGTILLGLDFDGTLAPLVDHPDLAVPDPKAISILGRLAARPQVDVAVVSGRALSDLRARLGDLPCARLIGEHGNDSGEETSPSPLLEQAREFVGNLRESVGEATVENKQRSVTFHTRHLTPEVTAVAVRTVREWAHRHEGISLLEGRDVLELTVATRNKGDAILELGLESDGIIFLGDDATDETVFEKLRPGDIGVKVGEGATAADYRVRDVAEVVDLLEVIDLASSVDGPDLE